MLVQTFDHSLNDLFNQCINTDSTSSDSNKEAPFLGDIDQLIFPGPLPSDCGDPSPIGVQQHQLCSPQACRRGLGLWCLPQDASSSVLQQTIPLHDTVQPPAISESGISIEASSPAGESSCLLSSSPCTPPATPNRRASGSFILTSKSDSYQEPNDRDPLPQRHRSFPNLMHTMHSKQPRMALPGPWTSRLQNLNSLQYAEERLPISPSLSDIVAQHENIRQGGNCGQLSIGSCGSSSHRAMGTPEMTANYGSNILHQMATDTVRRQGHLNHPSSTALATPSPSPAVDILHSRHASESRPIPTWHADALGTPAIPFAPDIHSHDAQSWWPPASPVSRVSLASNRHPYLPTVMPSLPREVTQAISPPNDLFQGGLMVQLDPSLDITPVPDPSLALPGSPISPGQQSNPSCPGLRIAEQSPACCSPYTRLGPSHITHRSRPQSLSPTPISSRSGIIAHNDTSVKKNGRRPQSRKLGSRSANGLEPTDQPHAPANPKGAKKSMSVSFVNYTAEDSHKILTGVAPSGSSKTKARRDQEAREKRRKLSEAALMAVKLAGGDVEALEAVLC